MSALLWMVAVSFLLDHSKATPFPYVTLNPNWKTIFEGEKVYFTCNVIYSTGWKREKIYWYKDNEQLNIYQQTFQIKHAQTKNSGNYQCKTTTSNRSDPVRLDVSNDWLILQVPSHIYKGDKLTLNCHGWDLWFSSKMVIYKDNHIIGDMGHHIDEMGAGVYQCKRQRLITFYTSKEVYVHVYELFSVPVLDLTPPFLTEGDVMTLRCDTILAPRRRTTELQFAFYKNEEKVQEFSPNEEYRISSAQLEDSGKYSCEVKTLLGTVREMSDVLSIQVQELFKTPVIQVFPSATVNKEEKMLLQCVTISPTGSHLLYSFFKDSRTVRDYTTDNTYLIPQAREDHSGNYQCSSKTGNNKVLKQSKDFSIVVKSERPYGPIDKGDVRNEDSESSVGLGQPRLILLPDKVVVGDEITLRCESSTGFSPIHYRFHHNGTTLGNLTVSQKRSAEIRQIIKSAAVTGPYYCDSRFSISSKIWLSENVNLFIIDPVANISITMENDDEDFVFGESVTLTCSIRRGTSPSFLWFHNEKVVEQVSMFYQLQGNQKYLHIDSLQSHHRGTYRCIASNNLPPNRTFSAQSAPRNINVMEPSPVESGAQFNVLWVVLVVLVTSLTSVLSFMYRQKIALIFRRCALQKLKTERTEGQARITQNPTNGIRESSSGIGQEDYSNIPSRVNVVCEDVCYAHVDINRVKEVSPHPNKGKEEFSVTYSAVKFSPSTTDPRTSQGTPDYTDLYMNFNAK